MDNKVCLQHKDGGLMEVKLGFSWTAFFFFIIPDVLRGHVGGVLILLLGQAIALTITNNFFPDMEIATYLIVSAVYASVRNLYLLESYLKDGWVLQ